MSKIILDHSLGTSGDSWLAITGEVLNVASIFPHSDIEVMVHIDHQYLNLIKTQISRIQKIVPWVTLKEVN